MLNGTKPSWSGQLEGYFHAEHDVELDLYSGVPVSPRESLRLSFADDELCLDPGVRVSPRESLRLSFADDELCLDPGVPVSPRESLRLSLADDELCLDPSVCVSPRESLRLLFADDELCLDPGVRVSPRESLRLLCAVEQVCFYPGLSALSRESLWHCIMNTHEMDSLYSYKSQTLGSKVTYIVTFVLYHSLGVGVISLPFARQSPLLSVAVRALASSEAALPYPLQSSASSGRRCYSTRVPRANDLIPKISPADPSKFFDG